MSTKFFIDLSKILLALLVTTTTALLIANRLHDDLFMGWAFMLWVVPGFFVIHAGIALPTTLFGEIKSKHAGWIAWLLTTSVLIGFGVYLFLIKWQPITQHMDSMMFYIVLLVVPQAATYYLSPDRPIFRPLVAGGLGLGSALLWIILAVLTGSTPD